VLALLLALVVAATTLTTGAVPPAAPTHFLWPARGTITTPFFPGGHPGIDIGILRSLTVRAAAAGVVTNVGEPRGFEGYGRIVKVDVGGGYSTLYAHLARYRVRMGERVSAGEPLGVAGCTGWCTGTHLHFEVRLDGRSVSPFRIPLG
jgi:murein DD-endopeptidase MepM/ murein hydrolase activator NlpD